MIFRLTLVTFLALIIAPRAVAQFRSVSVVNVDADSDMGFDNAVSFVSRKQSSGLFEVHAVWASNNDYTGNSGPDGDIFYSRFSENGGWSQPILVNAFGHLDSGDDFIPKLALGPDNKLHCVWISNSDFAGTGTDFDVFYSKLNAGVWKTAEAVNDFAADDNSQIPQANDLLPSIAFDGDGRVIVAWSSNYNLMVGDPPAPIGTDTDILWSKRTGGLWSATKNLNHYAVGDVGEDLGRIAMATTEDGTVAAAWSSTEPQASLGVDSDIVWSVLPNGGDWTITREVTARARFDTPADLDVEPAIAILGSGFDTEYHIAWAGAEDFSGAGTDFDVLHSVKKGLDTVPTSTPANFVNSNFASDAFVPDHFPALLFEPGGVLTCAWRSAADVMTVHGPTGMDSDIFYSTNASLASAWSPMALLSENGLSDGPADVDDVPSLDLLNLNTDEGFDGIAPYGLLTAMWHSTDPFPAGATDYGTDLDILFSIGIGRTFSRPELINTTGRADDPNPGMDADGAVRIAVGPDNDLHAVWSSTNPNLDGGGLGTDNDVFYARKTGEDWSDPQLVNRTGDTDTGQDIIPDIGVDHGGTIHIVWRSDENIGGNTGIDPDLFYANKNGPNFSQPQLVNSGGTADGGVNSEENSVRIKVAPDGTVHVAWTSDSDNPIITSNISYAKRAGGVWSPSEYVNAPFANPASSMNAFPALELDSMGNPHVVWQTDADYNSAGPDFDIFYSCRTGGSWSAPEFVNDAANDGSIDAVPALAIDPIAGFIYVVWSSDLPVNGAGPDFDLYSATKAEGVWTQNGFVNSFATQDSPTDHDLFPSVAVGIPFLLHVLWTGNYDLEGIAGADLDLFYEMIVATGLPSLEFLPILANPAGYHDTSAEIFGQILIDQEGYLHIAWASVDSLGNVIGADFDALHSQSYRKIGQFMGPPVLGSVEDNQDGSIHMTWTNPSVPPLQHFGFGYDIYSAAFIPGGIDNSIFFPYATGQWNGDIPVEFTGAYHFWISNQYAGNEFFPSMNPWTGIIYSGTPHTPTGLSVADQGGGTYRLNWDPEIFGTWLIQIIVFQVTSFDPFDGVFIPSQGPTGNVLFHWIDYGESTFPPGAASFFSGYADFTLPEGDYLFQIQGVSWLPPFDPLPTGDLALSEVFHAGP